MGDPTTLDECRALRAWAETLPVNETRPATSEQIEDHLRFLMSTLPTQGHNADAGRRRVSVYLAMLSGYSNEALAHMSREVCRTQRWMPVPAVLIEFADSYRAPESERAATLRLCSDFAQGQMDRWLDDVRDGLRDPDGPERWQRISIERGDSRRLHDGTVVSRARYHGPSRPVPRFG